MLHVVAGHPCDSLLPLGSSLALADPILFNSTYVYSPWGHQGANRLSMSRKVSVLSGTTPNTVELLSKELAKKCDPSHDPSHGP